MHRPRPLRMAAPLVAGMVLVGSTACSTFGAPDSPGPAAAEPGPPPAPPAACLLDTDALAAATDLAWTVDVTTASDTRCVYDPAAPAAAPAPSTKRPAADRTSVPADPEFLAVDVTPASGAAPAEQLDVLAEACEAGSRQAAGPDGFVCRFPGGSLFAARVRTADVVTVAGSGVPAGTTAEALSTELARQLGALG